MPSFTSATNWIKVFDEGITARWAAELAHSGEEITPSMIEWIIQELRWKTQLYHKQGVVEAFDCGIVKSDSAIPKDLQRALKQAIIPLENVPEDQKDYHPDSDGKVINLVHPSLFPVVFGRTHVLPDRLIDLNDCLGSMGLGVPLLVTPDRQIKRIPSLEERFSKYRYIVSPHYQWLPCDVEISGDYGCKILSYINNIHPVKHLDLYAVIEKIIACVFPLWEISLKYSQKTHGRRRIIKYEKVEYGENPSPKPIQSDGEDQRDYFHRLFEWVENAPIILPEPGIFDPFEADMRSPKVDLRESFCDNKLQIIVKLANIELGPEKPHYGGGSWHIEGHLVSKGIILGRSFILLTPNRMSVSVLRPYTTTTARTSQRANYPFGLVL